MELSEENIDILKKTSKLITINSEAIAERFYEVFFEKNPELKKLFKGSKLDHHKKLAVALVTFVDYIDDLEVLENKLNEIAEIQVKRNVKPEHYPLFESSMTIAIKDILKDDVTNEEIEAWKELFSFLSKTLISKEEKLYKSWYA